MKKIIKFTALICLIAGLSSCEKYLDIEPAGRVIPKTAADFRALLTSAYAAFPEHKSLLAARTDELVMDEFVTDYAFFSDIYKWNDNNPQELTSPFQYLGFYNVIFYANNVITEVEDKAGKNAETAQIKGEAYLLRAYSHFELLNLYAKPYDKNTAATDRGVVISLVMDLEQNHKPAKVEEVYTQILSDIAEGQKLLNVNTFDSGKNYRFTTRAALALEARVREFRGEWAQALAASQKALQLNNQLEDLNAAGSVSPNHYLSKESIMSMEKTFSSTITNVSMMSAHLLGIYDQANDLRFAKYFSKSGADYVSIKGNGPEFKTSFHNSELYLIEAEAALHNGNISLALESLFAVTAKRLKPAYFDAEKLRISALGTDALLQEIYKERERELALEGHRWYDLRRYGQPEISHTAGGSTFTLQKNDPKYTLRFPKEATERNPNLQ